MSQYNEDTQTCKLVHSVSCNLIFYQNVSAKISEYAVVWVIKATLLLFSLGQSWTLRLASTTTHPPPGTFRPLLGKVGGWNLVCRLYSQIWDQPRCHGRPVTILRMVTIQLQPFLPYVNLSFKNSHRTGIWLSNFITQAEHFRPYSCSHNCWLISVTLECEGHLFLYICLTTNLKQYVAMESSFPTTLHIIERGGYSDNQDKS